MRILIVEDQPDLLAALREGLTRHGFTVDTAKDGAVALQKAGLTPYDVVVLDRDLPGVHGDEVCRRLNAGQSPARILMLTAATTLGDRVHGLELGADDYLAKPFEYPELVARVRALGRRSVAAAARKASLIRCAPRDPPVTRTVGHWGSSPKWARASARRAARSSR